MSRRILTLVALSLLGVATPASAQILSNPSGALGPLGQAIPPLPTERLPVVGAVLTNRQQEQERQELAASALAQPSLDRIGVGNVIDTFGSKALARLRDQRLRTMILQFPEQLDRDKNGNPVRRGELVVIDPDAQTLADVAPEGFVPLREETVLGLRFVVLSIPDRGGDIRKAMKRLTKAAPGLDMDYNHVFEPAGGPLATTYSVALASGASSTAKGRLIAMIDGGVAAHQSMKGATIRQRGFVGKVVPTGHGTAVASLLVGDAGRFKGAAIGARLLVADVYGGNPAAGSATAIVRALGWAEENNAEVVNISLVGPPNKLLEKAIAQLQARNIKVVAAVGNDGPAAPPQYPASYNGVVAVTGVDAQGRAIREAGRAKHLDFAAPGADMAAALPAGGYAEVRGTSFAAPLATARLAAVGSIEDLSREAVDGRGKIGRGIVCSTCAITPKTVGAK